MSEAMTRDRFFEALGDQSPCGRELIQRAYWLAKNVHRVQVRDSGERYFEHPRRVALILMENGISDPEALIDALLHDVLEDTFTPPAVLMCLFGGDTYRQLETLSKSYPAEDKFTGQIIGWTKKPTADYYAGIARAAKKVRLVKCADRLDNLRSCDVWTPERIAKYIKETEDYVLPLARRTDPDLLAMIERETGRLLTELKSGQQ